MTLRRPPSASTMLERTVPFEIRDAGESGDGLTLRGYAAVFNSPTLIDSWEGRFNEVIAPGAFAKTIRERTPVLQFEHGRHPMVGSIPIGAINTIREDGEGLLVEARLADNWLTQPVRDAIANESINGMSFRFKPVKQEWHYSDGKRIKPENVSAAIYAGDPDNPPVRTLRELAVPELGPVVFPAYAGTSVGVRDGVDPILAALAGGLAPNVRAELARLLNSTSEASGAVEGAADDEEAARTEPGDHSADHRFANTLAMLPPLPRKAN